jgi:hypothetical protein
MNERIKECWLKAAREDSSDKWDTQEEFIERFAKLIVWECARVGDSGDPLQDGGIAKMIKQHFGIES